MNKGYISKGLICCLLGVIFCLSTGFKRIRSRDTGEDESFIHSRTGKLFLSTRTVEGNKGIPLLCFGLSFQPIICDFFPVGIITPIVFIPTGLAVGVLDQFVCSPVWDIICLPGDLKLEQKPVEPRPPVEPHPPVGPNVNDLPR